MGLQRILVRGMVLGLVVGLLSISASAHAAEGETEPVVSKGPVVSKEWESVELERPTGFMVFTAWSPSAGIADTPGILMHDPAEGENGTTWLIKKNGQVEPLNSFSGGNATFRFAKADSGYVRVTGSQFGGDFQIRQLGSNLQQIAFSDFGTLDLSKSSEELMPYAIYDFVVAQDQLFGFGPFKTQDRSADFEDTGFFTFSLSGGRPNRGRLLETKSPADRDYFLAGFSYMTAMGPNIYFISMSDVPELYRFNLHSDMRPVPLGFRPMGDQLLPRMVSSRELDEALSPTEKIHGFPFDLFVHAGYLYCLTRSPVSDFDNEFPQWNWTLTKLGVGSETAVVKGTELLPSRARFVRVLPSPDHLFVLEGVKSAVGDEDLKIERLVYRPRG